ncbi:uncharacterized protein LOC141538289 [Cotesia typhae]|uniref:uncharacterized protein LOC141538289 n=1 Tax=Cotesia typhae TaxID=2053667 RepID=UPI003D68298A
MKINVIIILLVINAYLSRASLSNIKLIEEILLKGCCELGTICDPTSFLTCCNDFSLCRSTESQSSGKTVFKRQSRAIVGEYCTNDVDCLRLDYAVCSNSYQCSCLPGYGLLEWNERCVLLLGGNCKRDVECIVPHAVCVENKCQCEEKFIATSPKQCSRTSIGARCATDIDCNDILHVGCSVGKKCVCKDNHRLINNSKCMPMLDEFCWSDERCAVDNSVCFKNRCRCKSDYRAVHITHCIKLKLGKLCNSDEDCSEVLHAVCSLHKRCICEENYLMLGPEECRKPPQLINGY